MGRGDGEGGIAQPVSDAGGGVGERCSDECTAAPARPALCMPVPQLMSHGTRYSRIQL
jgi:hypothetical protein